MAKAGGEPREVAVLGWWQMPHRARQPEILYPIAENDEVFSIQALAWIEKSKLGTRIHRVNELVPGRETAGSIFLSVFP